MVGNKGCNANRARPNLNGSVVSPKISARVWFIAVIFTVVRRIICSFISEDGIKFQKQYPPLLQRNQSNLYKFCYRPMIDVSYHVLLSHALRDQRWRVYFSKRLVYDRNVHWCGWCRLVHKNMIWSNLAESSPRFASVGRRVFSRRNSKPFVLTSKINSNSQRSRFETTTVIGWSPREPY